jgi:hypothetical protein
MLDFRGLLKNFFTREVIIFFIIVFAVAVLSIIFLVVRSFITGTAEIKAEYAPPVIGKPEEAAGDYSVYDLIIPDEMDRYFSPALRYYRGPRESWSREEIDTYWVDPRRLGIDILTRENRRFLDELFDSVP